MNRFTLPDAQIDGEPLTGANIILVPDDPGSFAVAGGDPADVLHVTLKFLGDAADWDPAQRAACEEHVARWAAARKPYKAKCSGVGTLGDQEAAVYHLNMDGLTDDRAVLSAMIDDGTEPDTTDTYDGYTPHLTAGYKLPALPPRPEGEHTFSKARIQWADEVVEFPLGDQPEAQVAASRRRIRRLPGRPVDPDFRHDYHDPSTGKFAPLGFVSPQVLKKLLSDDQGERFQAEMAIRKMFDKPEAREWTEAFRDAPEGPGRSHVARKAREEVIGVRPVGSTPEARRKQQAWDRASDLVARGLTSEPLSDAKPIAEAAPEGGLWRKWVDPVSGDDWWVVEVEGAGQGDVVTVRNRKGVTKEVVLAEPVTGTDNQFHVDESATKSLADTAEADAAATGRPMGKQNPLSPDRPLTAEEIRSNAADYNAAYPEAAQGIAEGRPTILATWDADAQSGRRGKLRVRAGVRTTDGAFVEGSPDESIAYRDMTIPGFVAQRGYGSWLDGIARKWAGDAVSVEVSHQHEEDEAKRGIWPKPIAEAAPSNGDESPATPTLLEAARMGGTVRATVVDVGRMRKFAEGDVIEARYRDDTYAAVYVPLPNGKRRRYLVRWDRLGDPQLEAADGAVYSTPEATAALVNTEGPQRLRVGSGRLSYLGLKAGHYVDVEPTGTAYGEVAGIVTGPNGRKYRVKWGHFDAVHPDGPETPTPDAPEEDGSLESVDDDKLAQLKADAIDKLNLTPDDPTLAAELGAVLDEEARRAAEAGNTDREAKLRKNADHWWGKAGGRPTDRDGTDTEQPTPAPAPEPEPAPAPEPEPAPTPEPPSTGIGDGGGTYGPGDIPSVFAEYPTDKVSSLSYRMNDDGTVTLLLPDGAVMTIPLKAGSLWYGINRDTGLWDAKFQKSRPKAFAWNTSDYIYGGLGSKGNGADLVDQVLESDSYKARVVNRLVQRALAGAAVTPESQRKVLAKRFADLGFKGHTADKGTVNPPEPTGRTKGPWGDDQALLDEMQAIFAVTGNGYSSTSLTPEQLRLEGWDKRIDAAIESLEARIVAGDLDVAQRHGDGLHRLRTAQTRANKRSDQFVTVYGGVSSNWEQNRASAKALIDAFQGDGEWDKIVWSDALPGTMTNGAPVLKAWLEDPTDAKKASALAAILAHMDALVSSSATPMHADQDDDARLRNLLGMLNIHKDAMFDLPADNVIGSLLDPFTHDSLTAFRSAAEQHAKSVGAKKRATARMAIKETADLLDPPDINDPVEFIPILRQLHGIGEGHLKHSEVRDLLVLSFDERTSPSPSRTAALDEAVARVKWIDGKADAYANGSLLAAPSSATDYAAISEGTYSKLGVSKYDLSHYGLRTGPKAKADQDHWDATWADVLADERMSDQIDAWGAPIAVFFTKGSKGIAWAAPGTSQIGWSKNRATKHAAKYDESYAWVRENVVHEDAALVGEVPMSTAHVKAMMWPDGQMVKYGTAAHHYGNIEWGVDFTSGGFARHEYGHIVDGRLSKAKLRRREYDEWAQYVKDHPKARLEVSKYAKHNMAEAFAETYAVVMHPRYADRRGFSPEAEEMLRLFEAVIAPLAAEELGVVPADTVATGGVL